MALPSYKDIANLIKKGATIEAQEKIMELRESALELQEENINLKNKVLELQEEVRKLESFEGGLVLNAVGQRGLLSQAHLIANSGSWVESEEYINAVSVGFMSRSSLLQNEI